MQQSEATVSGQRHTCAVEGLGKLLGHLNDGCPKWPGHVFGAFAYM